MSNNFGIIFIMICCISFFVLIKLIYKKNEDISDGINFYGHGIFWSCKVSLLPDSILVNHDSQVDERILYSSVYSVKQYTFIKEIVILKYIKEGNTKKLVLQIDAPIRFVKEVEKHNIGIN